MFLILNISEISATFNMTYISAPCIQENIGNKQCEASQNHAACQYDGGDCCLHWTRLVRD